MLFHKEIQEYVFNSENYIKAAKLFLVEIDLNTEKYGLKKQ